MKKKSLIKKVIEKSKKAALLRSHFFKSHKLKKAKKEFFS
jgi:hypothetical protein